MNINSNRYKFVLTFKIINLGCECERMLILQYENVFHQLTTFDDISQFPFDPKERVKIVYFMSLTCVVFSSSFFHVGYDGTKFEVDYFILFSQ